MSVVFRVCVAACVCVAVVCGGGGGGGVALPGHPRLVVSAGAIDAAQRAIATQPLAKQLYAASLAAGTALLDAPPVVPVQPGPSGILDLSRKVVGRMYTLGLLHLLDAPLPAGANTTWAQRGAAEAAAVARFPTWNPAHFLDVAEMTSGLAVGMDWMWSGWTDDQRRGAADAIRRLGLDPGLRAYNGSAPTTERWWVGSPSNWNQVCNGGLLVGALAVMDVPQHAAVATTVMRRALASLPVSLEYYGPNGVWWEGAMYAGYAMKYGTLALSVLNSTFGNDTAFGLPVDAGINNTGVFLLRNTDPRGHFFKWSDCDSSPNLNSAADLMFLSRRFDVPLYAYTVRTWLPELSSLYDGWGSAELLLLRYSAAGDFADLAALPTSSVDDVRHVGWFRTQWEAPATGGHITPDAADAFLAFKGGNNTYSREWVGLGVPSSECVSAGDACVVVCVAWQSDGHLDAGQFVFELDKYRWADDLGVDNYGLPGYFGAERWSYYRLNSLGHNVLRFNNNSQWSPLHAAIESPIAAFNVSTDSRFAVMNLTDVYFPNATSVLRGVALLTVQDTVQVVVADDFVSSQAATWVMHTSAVVTAVGNTSATLAVPGVESLTVKLLSAEECPGTRFYAEPLVLPPPHLSTRGITRLYVRYWQRIALSRVALRRNVGV